MDFPWRPTVREFLEHVRSERGVAIKRSKPVKGPRGDVEWEIVSDDELGRSIAISLGCDLDDRLTPTVLRSLCVQFEVPPDDFLLDPRPRRLAA